VLVIVSHLRPSLILETKARAYLSGDSSLTKVRALTQLANIRLGWKCQTRQLIRLITNVKSFIILASTKTTGTFLYFSLGPFLRRNDIRYDDTQHNDTQRNNKNDTTQHLIVLNVVNPECGI
jgi:hypothetical protein